MNFSWYMYANYAESISSFTIFNLYIKTWVRLSSEDTDQTVLKEQSDLNLHFLLKE